MVTLQLTKNKSFNVLLLMSGRSNSVGCASAWYADGRGFDPHALRIFGHEQLSTVLPLIQEGKLPVTCVLAK